MSSELSPAEKRQVCLSASIKGLDSLKSRLLSCDRPTTGTGHPTVLRHSCGTWGTGGTDVNMELTLLAKL